MKSFEFYPAENLNQVLSILADRKGSCKVLAGGTDLMVELKNNGLSQDVKVIVDITKVQELRGISCENDMVRIGPLTTHAEIASSDLLKTIAGFLPQACSKVGSPQIRNRGTVGGNIVNSSPCADSLPTLVALEVLLEIQKSGGGKRVVPIDEFLNKPYKPNLDSDELLTGIVFKKPPEGTKSCFIKVGRRKALAVARLSLAVIVIKENDGFRVRISPGAAFARADRARIAENFVMERLKFNGELSPEDRERAGKMVSQEMVDKNGFRWSTEYKFPVLAGVTSRALGQLLGGENNG